MSKEDHLGTVGVLTGGSSPVRVSKFFWGLG
jgi:hypothetical protein